MTRSPDVYFALVPVLNRSQPDFCTAGWRIVEAARRFNELIRKVPDVASEWQGHPVVRAPRDNPDALELSLEGWSWNHTPSARALTFLASEVLHHARVSLDYCAYHVVWLDTGQVREKTKFPLVEVENKWGNEKRKAIPGVAVEHSNWIRDVQPFKGTSWTTALAELSNRDKHRTAAEIVATYRYRVDRSKRYGDPRGDTTYLGYAVEDSRLELHVAPAMSNGSGSSGPRWPLEPTLWEILEGACGLVNLFLRETGVSTISLERQESRETDA